MVVRGFRGPEHLIQPDYEDVQKFDRLKYKFVMSFSSYIKVGGFIVLSLKERDM